MQLYLCIKYFILHKYSRELLIDVYVHDLYTNDSEWKKKHSFQLNLSAQS